MITEIKNTLEGISSRISEAEEQISELEDKMVEGRAEQSKKNNPICRTEKKKKTQIYRTVF